MFQEAGRNWQDCMEGHETLQQVQGFLRKCILDIADQDESSLQGLMRRIERSKWQRRQHWKHVAEFYSVLPQDPRLCSTFLIQRQLCEALSLRRLFAPHKVYKAKFTIKRLNCNCVPGKHFDLCKFVRYKEHKHESRHRHHTDEDLANGPYCQKK